MRFWQAGLAALSGAVVSASAAEASSFVYVAPPSAASLSPSFAVVGQIPPPARARTLATAPLRSPLDAPPDHRWEARPRVISASVVALGDPVMRTPEHAPIPKPARRALLAKTTEPMVIRGGTVGGAFPGGPQTVAAAAPAVPAAAVSPEAGKREVSKPAKKPQPAKSPAPKPQSPEAPPQPQPVAAPPRPPEPPPPAPDTLLAPNADRPRPM